MHDIERSLRSRWSEIHQDPARKISLPVAPSVGRSISRIGRPIVLSLRLEMAALTLPPPSTSSFYPLLSLPSPPPLSPFFSSSVSHFSLSFSPPNHTTKVCHTSSSTFYLLYWNVAFNLTYVLANRLGRYKSDAAVGDIMERNVIPDRVSE